MNELQKIWVKVYEDCLKANPKCPFLAQQHANRVIASLKALSDSSEPRA